MYECNAVWDTNDQTKEWNEGSGPPVLSGWTPYLYKMETLQEKWES